MDLHIAGLTAVVTGGTRGIGNAVATAFLREGARVAFCARNADEVEDAQKRLTELGTAAGAVVNVRDYEAVRAWIAGVAQRFGTIDMVVSNVSAFAVNDTPENWRESFDVDLMGAVNFITVCMPLLERSKHPSIVAISSVSAREIDFAAGPYAALKSAIVCYVAGLARQLAPKGIRANIVSPGNTYYEGGPWLDIKKNVPDLYRQALALNPTGRMGTPGEVAESVVFLSSPLSSRTTGANLLIDGALTKSVQF